MITSAHHPDPAEDTDRDRDADHPVDVRLKMAALWTATMLAVVFVDLFSLYRPDVRADIESGKIFVFEIGQPFLFFSMLYVVIPIVMIYLSVALPRRVNRPANVAVAGLYLVSIVGLAVGEWSYYVLGSLVESVFLLLVIHHAWTWSRPARAAAHAV
jgi:hypothetical protein